MSKTRNPFVLKPDEDPSCVVTVGMLKALLESYDDDMIVHVTEDFISSRQVVGFCSVADIDSNRSTIVLRVDRD